MNDIASNTFLSKWPNWLRWLCFLPAAIIVPFLIIIIQNLTTRWYLGIEGKNMTLELLGDFWLGAGFVGIGAMVAPKKQFLVSVILLIIITIISSMSFLGNLLSKSINLLEALLHCVIVIGSGVYFVYHFHQEELTTIDDTGV